MLYILLGKEYDLDGSILSEAFKDENLPKNTNKEKAEVNVNKDSENAEYSEEERKCIEDRLRDLDYI